jgi:hypothetical protein
MNHYDVRSIYSGEIGEALARAFDLNVAARGSPTLAALPWSPASGRREADGRGFVTDGTKLWQGIFNAGVTLDQNDIPQGDRFGFFKPVQYALVVMSEKPINRDLNGPLGANGIPGGQVERINNIVLVKTNNLPNLDDSANLNIPANRRHDYSVTQGLIQHRNAVGTVAASRT